MAFIIVDCTTFLSNVGCCEQVNIDYLYFQSTFEGIEILFRNIPCIFRLDDYHHHSGDVLCGSLIGTCLAYLCYRQYFPSLGSRNCQKSYAELKARELADFPSKLAKSSSSQPEARSFLDEEKESKWI